MLGETGAEKGSATMSVEQEAFVTLLAEERIFPPPAAFRHRARAADPAIYDRAETDPEAFWSELAQELTWFEPPTQTLTTDRPQPVWFTGGRLNASYNCLDRHLAAGRGSKTALFWEGEPGDRQSYTYRELCAEVGRAANALKRLGVCPGDRVAIYLPMIPELVIAVLACARLGAIHTVVFGGFSVEALRERLVDARATVLVTADGGYRRGVVIPFKETADEALVSAPEVRHVVVVRRVGHRAGAAFTAGRDHWWHELLAASAPDCLPEPMEANDPLFILYTSGTTGRPKGVVHTTGGYLVGAYATTKLVFDLTDQDVYWCTADIGWITGHSYVIYGPLALGATVVLYEGAPDHPSRDRFWEIIARYGVSVFYTAPTAIRTFMRWGDSWPAQHDLSSLRLLGTVGEPINPDAWLWFHQVIGGERCPICDTWWQTETGAIMIAPLPGLVAAKPGSATRPFPGIKAAVVDAEGQPVAVGTSGYLVITTPWPAMALGIWGDEHGFHDKYFGRFPGCYFTGDGARQDADGYFWLLGRIDDVIKVSGHRLGTMEVESALVDHAAVAEAAVIGRQHEIKGQAIAAFVTLKDGMAASEELAAQLRMHVAERIGAIAKPDEIIFTGELPKTRSGKIMRRLLRDIAERRVVGDVSTLADAAVISRLTLDYPASEAQDSKDLHA